MTPADIAIDPDRCLTRIHGYQTESIVKKPGRLGNAKNSDLVQVSFRLPNGLPKQKKSYKAETKLREVVPDLPEDVTAFHLVRRRIVFHLVKGIAMCHSEE